MEKRKLSFCKCRGRGVNKFPVLPPLLPSSAFSCLHLPNRRWEEIAKSTGLSGRLMVAAQGIEPWTSLD